MDLFQLGWLFFGFRGRISRAAYFLAAILMSLVLAFLLYRTVLSQDAMSESRGWGAALNIAIVVSLWAQAALGAKRIHDFGKPGLFAVALFLPGLNFIAFLVLCVIPGDSGPNQYAQQTNSPS